MSNSIGTGFSVAATGKSGYTTGGLGDLVGFIPGLGIPLYVNNKASSGRIILGGGIKGRMPQPVVDQDHTDNFARDRFTLRTAWNTSSFTGSSNPRRMITPFRAVNNAGDLLCRQNYSCGGPCQTPQSRPGVYGLRQAFGATGTSCRADIFWTALQVDPKVPSSTCNTKFVYDGSDYTRYKKDLAINKNYNDLSYGGNEYNGAQSAWRRSRRY